jgi:ABC-type sulfate/molybdate transport systems ATPase subunit
VALARVLALEPEILLLDEPLVILIILERMPCVQNLFQPSDLDLYCTHDSTDALSLLETIVLQHGKLVDKAASMIYITVLLINSSLWRSE